MKKAVSIPDDIFEGAETLARRAKRSRSEVSTMKRSISLCSPLLLSLCLAWSCGSQGASESQSSQATGGAGAGAGMGGSTQVPVIVLGPSPVASGAPDSSDGSCAAINQEAETTKQPADIIWAIDTSGSMMTEAQAVQDNMNLFAQQITASGIDVHVVLLSAEPLNVLGINLGGGVCIGAPLGSGQCPADSLPPNYLHVPVRVDSHDALNIFVNNYRAYAPMLRPQASKTFVVVTDDEGNQPPNNSAAAFTMAIKAADPAMFANFRFSGVYCTSPCPNCAGMGVTYEKLRQQTGGVYGNMCMTDFVPVFKALAESVITSSKLSCDWAIPPPPPGQTFNPGLVNVIYTPSGQAKRDILNVPASIHCGAQGGWYYDDPANPTKISACPATCSEIQGDVKAKIDVAFGCGTKIIIK